MIYKGHVQNGAIVLDEPVNLSEGAIVSFEIAMIKDARHDQQVPTLAERLASIIGKAEGLPADWSENNDIYL